MKSIAVAGGVGLVLAFSLTPAAPGKSEPRVQSLRTSGGVGFALLGEKPTVPAPTLFVFATGAEETLTDVNFIKVGRILAGHGWLSVAVDVPCHGQDVQKGKEPA